MSESDSTSRPEGAETSDEELTSVSDDLNAEEDEAFLPKEFPQILFQDSELLLMYKPQRWFVHPPENPRFRRGLKRRTCVQWLSDEHDIKAFPAHRLDAATDGILVFGMNKNSTAHLNSQFKNHEVEKIYHCAVRGWLKEPEGQINLELELTTTGQLVNCETNYRTLAKVEHNVKVSKKFDTSRYSLLEVRPKTGRWHQIRRHMNRVSHPIVGDREHGDSHHNRYFRDTLKLDGLFLWASELSFLHPTTGERVRFKSPMSDRWKELFKIFDYPVDS